MLIITDCEGCRGTLGAEGCPKHRGWGGTTYLDSYPRMSSPPVRGWECPKCGSVWAPSFPGPCCANSKKAKGFRKGG